MTSESTGITPDVGLIVIAFTSFRLIKLFDYRNCDDWWQRPPEGSYMVACDQGTLESFFDSGIAINEGALAASPLAAVTEGP